MLQKTTESLGLLTSPLLLLLVLSRDKPELSLIESAGETGSSDEQEDDKLLPELLELREWDELTRSRADDVMAAKWWRRRSITAKFGGLRYTYKVERMVRNDRTSEQL